MLEQGYTIVPETQSSGNAAGTKGPLAAQQIILPAALDARLLLERRNIRIHTQMLEKRERELEAKEAAFEKLQARSQALQTPSLMPSGQEICPHPGCNAKVNAPAQVSHLSPRYILMV